jgi:hypothetical protein
VADALARLTTALADRYAIERALGRGGMAMGGLATDLRHDRPVTLKALRPAIATRTSRGCATTRRAGN